MRTLKLFLAIIFAVSIATAWELRTIHGQGLDHATSLVITITSDNYSNINTFWDGANQLRDYLIAAAPFNTFSDRIIINALGRTGNNFGSVAGGHVVSGTNVNNVRSTINNHTSNGTNVFLLLNNSTMYGGVAHNQNLGPNSGLLAIANHPGQGNWRGLMLHEMGHVWGDLHDEYDGPWCPQNTAANQSTDGNSNTNKWRHWIGIDGVGIFPLTGAWGQGCGLVSGQSWFRPHQSCRMRDNVSDPFCRVCQASITRVSANVMGQPFWGGNQSGTSVNIPAGRTHIMFAEFHAMPNLASITIPASVTTIGDFAFLACPNLRTINIDATTPPAINNTTFHGLTRANIVVNVPAGTRQAYINAGWTDFDIPGDDPSSINGTKKSGKHYGIIFAVNPVSEQAEINVILPNNDRAVETNVVIYDMVGNVVFEEKATNRTPVCRVIWDLRNPAGRFVANGTYLVVVEAKNINGRIYRYSARLGVKR